MYIAIDCELGGPTPDYSLLSFSYCGADRDFNILYNGQFYVKTKAYVLTPFQVNLPSMNAIATPAEEITKRFKHSMARLGRDLTLVGYGLATELPFIYKYIIPESEFREYVNPDFIELSTLVSLTGADTVQDLAKYYGITDDRINTFMYLCIVEEAKNALRR